MARAERMLTDDAIAHEVATYNELIPDAGELSGTLFIEITDEAALRDWLPKLIGIEWSVHFELGDGTSRVTGVPQDEERLTRDDITSTVHYLKFPFDPEAAGAARVRSCRGSSSTTRPTRRRWSSPRRSAPSSRATSRSSAVHDPRPPTRPRPAAPASAARRRRRLRPPRPRDAPSLAAAGGRALVPTGLAVAIPSGLRRVRPAPLRARAASRDHVPQHARADRLRCTAASSRCCS